MSDANTGSTFALCRHDRRAVHRFMGLLEAAEDALVVVDETGLVVLVMGQAAVA
ncbi:hypothetical protein [Streptomyces tauricus]|uniref:hypothetical protein n=1 Tax=Streptomyces tauricus TaxID=68274 RepID=UPI003421C1E3